MTDLLAGAAVALGGGMLSAAALMLPRLEAGDAPAHPIEGAFPFVAEDPELQQLLDQLA